MAGFTPKACVDALVAVLESINGIGRVHPRRRIIRDEQALRDLLFDVGRDKVCGWMISPAGSATITSQRHPGFRGIGQAGGGQVDTTFQFQIEGYFGLDDAADSESDFRDLCWTAVDTLNSYGLIQVPGITMQTATDLEQFGYIYLAGFSLLHYARLNIGLIGRTRP